MGNEFGPNSTESTAITFYLWLTNSIPIKLGFAECQVIVGKTGPACTDCALLLA